MRWWVLGLGLLGLAAGSLAVSIVSPARADATNPLSALAEIRAYCGKLDQAKRAACLRDEQDSWHGALRELKAAWEIKDYPRIKLIRACIGKHRNAGYRDVGECIRGSSWNKVTGVWYLLGGAIVGWWGYMMFPGKKLTRRA